MRKVIRARYNGYCRICRGRIHKGETIVYYGSKHSNHLHCDEGGNAEDGGNGSSPVAGSGNAAPVSRSGKGEFRIEWPELRDFILEGMKGNYPKLNNASNKRTLQNVLGSENAGFRGYSLTQAKDWLESGYETDALREMADFAPPIRDKRRFVYADEGDEIDLSAAWSGEDNFMTQWTKREVIPGVAIEFYVNLYAGVNASVVNAFIHWIAQAVFAIEAAGIDPEIVFGVHSEWQWSSAHRHGGYTKVRVKKEMETVDSNYWSAMLSPAAFRTFGFTSIILAADSIGCYADGGIDRPNTTDVWDVVYDPEDGVIRVSSPWSASAFPEAEMTQKLRNAIEMLKGKNN